MARFGQEPLLDLGMRLGEASGAAVATLILKAAVETHNGMATFAEAGVSNAALKAAILFAILALIALLAEAGCGYPDRVFAAIGHPVTWFGGLIDWLDRQWNEPARSRRARIALGAVLTALLLLLALVAGLLLHTAAGALLPPLLALLVLGVVAGSLLAQRSLHQHVATVRDALLQDDDLGDARRALSTSSAAIRQLWRKRTLPARPSRVSRNFSDGVVAPAFWLFVGGLPGGLAYKASTPPTA